MKNGTLVSAAGSYRANIVVKGEKIMAMITNEQEVEAMKVIDDEGEFVLPGICHANRHLIFKVRLDCL